MISNYFCHGCQENKPMGDASRKQGLCITCAGWSASTGVWHSHLEDAFHGLLQNRTEYDNQKQRYIIPETSWHGILSDLGSIVQEFILEVAYEVKHTQHQIQIHKDELGIFEQQADAATNKNIMQKLTDLLTFVHSSAGGQSFKEWETLKTVKFKELESLLELKEEQFILMLEQLEKRHAFAMTEMVEQKKLIDAQIKKDHLNTLMKIDRSLEEIKEKYRLMHTGVMKEHVCMICQKYLNENLEPTDDIFAEDIVEMNNNGE